jgi:hypothetical protein
LFPAAAIGVGKKHHHLWSYSVLFDPIEAGPEIVPTTAHRRQVDRLARLINLDLVYNCIEVQHIYEFGALAFKDGLDLSLEERQSPSAYRA